jgi:ubiquitin carboxyl-terminal hydrolase MINDY-1/2
MDLNPLFTGATSFRPRGDGGELKLFEQAGIKLVHGWLVDPESPESVAVSKTEDYDSALNLIADADHISKGLFLLTDDPASSNSTQAGPSSPTQNYTSEERQKIEDGRLKS